MVCTGRRFASPGNALMLLGFGHAAWALTAYGEPLRDIVRAGVVRTVGDGIFDRDHDRGARAAGFWFLLAAPLVAMDGYLTEAAAQAGNARAVRISGRTTLALGVVGATVIPRSGFPAAAPLGWWLLRRSRAMEVADHRPIPAARAAGTAERGGQEHVH
jgi:hypothetical protein